LTPGRYPGTIMPSMSTILATSDLLLT
jgi:hypothetical protein